MSNTFILKTNRTTTQSNLSIEADVRAANIITTKQTIKTASASQTQTTQTQNSLITQQDHETVFRINTEIVLRGNGDNSIEVGRKRTVVEDKNNLGDRRKIDAANLLISRVAVTSLKREQDITRHRQKNQSRCNHIFDVFDRRCILCRRAQSSHRYDQ